uniref:Uncharacterized protein n=1 Tax=Parastrongyloides trichosuri TaxID=131310 RepID=A0A0N4ZCG2_PARTI
MYDGPNCTDIEKFHSKNAICILLRLDLKSELKVGNLIEFFERCSVYYEKPLEIAKFIHYTSRSNELVEKYVGLLKRKFMKKSFMGMSFLDTFKWSLQALNNFNNTKISEYSSRHYYVNSDKPFYNFFLSKPIEVEKKSVFFKRRDVSLKVLKNVPLTQLSSRSFLIRDE